MTASSVCLLPQRRKLLFFWPKLYENNTSSKCKCHFFVSEVTNGKKDVSKSNLFDYHRSESHDVSDTNEQLYMAFWEYTKRKSGEISLRKGCVVDVLEKHLSGRHW